MNETPIPKAISIDLDSQRERQFAKAWGIEPLTAVVEKAVKTLNRGKLPPRGLNARWLAKVALRAVAEAVIRDGKIPMPAAVQLQFADYDHQGSLPTGDQ